jgi:peptidase A4-like protein
MRLVLVSLVALGLWAGVARAEPEVSSNWGGYAAIAPQVTDPATPATPVSFTNVTATWVEPKATCTVGRTSSAAFWVGIGGYDAASPSLEQLGTAADCDGSSKTPTHYAWWELVPAASVRIPLKINAGDRITAAVVIDGQKITFFLKDSTRKTRFSKVVVAQQGLDTGSAEWIAEAPSLCTSRQCRVVPLTNFGRVTFTNIAATADGHPGTLTAPSWYASPIELIANGFGDELFGGSGDVLGPGVGAVPAAPSTDGRSFAVSWQKNLTPPS